MYHHIKKVNSLTALIQLLITARMCASYLTNGINVMKYQIMQHKSAAISNNNNLALLNDDVCLPALLLKRDAALHNIRWMQEFANQHKAQLAPHAKTTMTPWLMAEQLKAGAWGLTVATPYQAVIAANTGAKNIILANQLVGPANIQVVLQLLGLQHKVFVFADNKDNVSALASAAVAAGLTLPLLIELGSKNGRCGCRDNQQALALAEHIHALPGVELAGIGFYEGAIDHNDNSNSIKHFVQQAAALAKVLFRQNLLQYEKPLLTGSGSAWYDIVARELNRATLPDNMQFIVRPGCYVTHDHGIYHQAQHSILQRSPQLKRLGPALKNALEVAAYIQSVPEPGLAIIGAGKRDAAFDAGLPAVLKVYRNGSMIAAFAKASRSFEIMDQHCFWHYPDNLQLQPGDMVLLATSHPCLTFDKWRTLYLADNDYNLLEELATCF